MSDSTGTYAQAIVMIARGEDALDVVDDELLTVARAVGEQPDLYRALADQHTSIERRMKLLTDALPTAHPATRSALALLVAAERVKDLEAVAQAVARYAAEERGRAFAEVWVAVELSEQRRQELQAALERATGKQLEMKVHVDPTVVGGVRAKVGDTVIDGSLARRLDDLQARVGGTR